MKFVPSLFFAAALSGSTLSVKAQLAQIPFEFTGTHLFVKVQTGKSDSLRFVFDSGATGATIDSAAAEKAGISKENRKTVSVAGSGGVQNYTMALHQSVKLDRTEVKDVNLTLVNFTSLSKEMGSRLDGIIGYEILNKYVTSIDFDHRKISLHDGLKSVDTAGYTGIPFEFSKNIMIPRFPVSITLANGETFKGKVMFDTGNAFTLIVSTPFSKYHNFSGKLGETSITQGRGMNAVTQDQLANIKSMSFNGFDFGKMAIRLTVNDKAEAKDGYLGILGIEVIKRFNVIIDYAGKKIYLKPNQSYNEAFKLADFPKNENEESERFLAKNKTKPGVKVTASGLQYKIIKQGRGRIAAMTDKVSMHYNISLVNGKKLWSTYDDKTPWVHHLDKALAGVREAVLLMPAGSKWELYIPASLAFGDDGYGPVPPGAAIIYETEVLEPGQ